MLEIGSRFRTERELTNRIDRIVQMQLVNLFSVRYFGEISSIVDTKKDLMREDLKLEDWVH